MIGINMGKEPSEGTTRRQLITILASVASGSLAGCIGDRKGGDVDVAGSPTVFGHTFSSLSGQAQLNPWAANYPWELYTLLFEPSVVSTPSGGHRLTNLLNAVTVDGTTVTVEYSDDFTWWNGEPVTARDQWVGHRINEFVVADKTPDVTLLDQYTLQYTLDSPLDRQLVLSRVINTIDTAAWLFSPWLERLEDATTRSGREDVIERLRGWKVSLKETSEKGFGYGPYEFSEVSPNRLLLERFEKHPRADELSIPTLWFPVAKGLQTDGLLSRGVLDGGRGLLDNRDVETPAYTEQLVRYPTAGGTKLVLNWRNDHLARRRVRQALLCALPIDDIVSTANWGEPTPVQTGMTQPPEERWLDEASRNRLRQYPIEADVARAAELMRAAGYERSVEDNRWHDADGNDVRLRLHTTLWDGWVSSAQLIEQSLNSFGFNVTVRQTSDASFLAVSQHEEFDLLLWWTTGRPYVAYDVTGTNPATVGYGLIDSSTDTLVQPSIPTHDGGSRTVNLLEQWRRIERPRSERETAAAASLFARWWNYDLPDILLATQMSGVWGNTRDFAWPSDDDRAYRTSGPMNRPEYYLLRTGAVRSRT